MMKGLPFHHIPLFLLIRATYIAVHTGLFSYVSRPLRSPFRLYLTPCAVPIDSDLPHVHTIHRAHLQYFIFHASRFTTYAPHFTLPLMGWSTYHALVHDQTAAPSI